MIDLVYLFLPREKKRATLPIIGVLKNFTVLSCL